ncbi:MAG: DUF4388 domain-containing protein [Alphaproteobacteria bacterium]|nr:DUF4388 domain-containing protein [Alphaproteobacteria bacterium]
MSRRRIGEVMVDLKLLTPPQVEHVLGELRTRERGRFGELALELGLVDEEGLARAVAEQFQLRMVPADKVGRISIAPDVLRLLPPELIRDEQVVPTFFDDSRKVLSLLVIDPTRIPGLKRAQQLTRAQRLRLFVTSRSALIELIDQLVPAPLAAAASAAPARDDRPRVTAVLETNIKRLGALRHLAEVEGEAVEIVDDPDQITALVEAGTCDRVVHRDALSGQVDPYVGAWRRVTPGLRVMAVPGFGPAHLPAVPYGAARDFFLGILEFALLAGETQQVGLRARIRRLSALAGELAREQGLSEEQVDAVSVAALFFHLEKLTAMAGSLGDTPQEGVDTGRFATAMGILEPHRPPYPLLPLFQALDRRLAAPTLPADHLGAELLFTVSRVVDAGPQATTDAAEILDGDGAQYDPGVLAALSRVLRREQLRAQLSGSGGDARRLVLIAERDAAQVTALETRLARANYEVDVVADGQDALTRARARKPAALIANLRLRRLDGLSLLMDLKQDPDTAGIAVFLLTDHSGPRDIARGLDLGAEDVLEKPVNLSVLMARLRRAVARAEPVGGDAGVSGQLSELSLADLIQTLSLGGRTAEVSLSGGAHRGLVYLAEGQVVHATHGNEAGEEAFFALLLWDEGRFAVRFGAASPPPNVTRKTDFLLLEGLRRIDEARR